MYFVSLISFFLWLKGKRLRLWNFSLCTRIC